MSAATPSKGLQRVLSNIWGKDPDDTMQKRMDYYRAAMVRQEFIEECREKGLFGKQYSDAVVAFDKMALQASV